MTTAKLEKRASKQDLGRLLIIFLGFLSLYFLNSANVQEANAGTKASPTILHDNRTFIAIEVSGSRPLNFSFDKERPRSSGLIRNRAP